MFRCDSDTGLSKISDPFRGVRILGRRVEVGETRNEPRETVGGREGQRGPQDGSREEDRVRERRVGFTPSLRGAGTGSWGRGVFLSDFLPHPLLRVGRQHFVFCSLVRRGHIRRVGGEEVPLYAPRLRPKCSSRGHRVKGAPVIRSTRPLKVLLSSSVGNTSVITQSPGSRDSWTRPGPSPSPRVEPDRRGEG